MKESEGWLEVGNKKNNSRHLFITKGDYPKRNTMYKYAMDEVLESLIRVASDNERECRD